MEKIKEIIKKYPKLNIKYSVRGSTILNDVTINDAKQVGIDKLVEIINNILDENQDVVEEIQSGNERPVGFLVGQVMKETRGKANPQLANKLIREEVAKR